MFSVAFWLFYGCPAITKQWCTDNMRLLHTCLYFFFIWLGFVLAKLKPLRVTVHCILLINCIFTSFLFFFLPLLKFASNIKGCFVISLDVVCLRFRRTHWRIAVFTAWCTSLCLVEFSLLIPLLAVMHLFKVILARWVHVKHFVLAKVLDALCGATLWGILLNFIAWTRLIEAALCTCLTTLTPALDIGFVCVYS